MIGIVGADAHEDLADDVDGILGPGGGQPGVEPDDGSQLRSAAGQFEREGPARAVADGRHLTGVGVLVGHQHLETGPSDRPHEVNVAHQLTEAGTDFLGRQSLPIPVIVEGEAHVAELRQSVGAALGQVVKAAGVVGHQHRRTSVGAAVVHDHVADQPGALVGVLDVGDVHFPPAWSTWERAGRPPARASLTGATSSGARTLEADFTGPIEGSWCSLLPPRRCDHELL